MKMMYHYNSEKPSRLVSSRQERRQPLGRHMHQRRCLLEITIQCKYVICQKLC